MMVSLRFDEEKHEYWLGQRQLVSVTTVPSLIGVRMRRYTDEGERESFAAIAGEYFESNQTAAKFGKHFHSYCAMRLHGTLPEAIEVPEGMRPWVDQWEPWYVTRWRALVERRCRVIVDWKTGAESDFWGPQLAGYDLMFDAWYAVQQRRYLFYVEEPMYHPHLLYAGTPDFVGGHITSPAVRRFVVQCFPDKQPREIEYKSLADKTTWLSLYNIYNTFVYQHQKG